MAVKTYVGAVGRALFQGMVAAGWSAAQSLSPGRRRAVRTGVVATTLAVGVAISRRELADLRTARKNDESAVTVSRDPEDIARMEAEMRRRFRAGVLQPVLRQTFDELFGRYRRYPVLGGTALFLSTAMLVGGRRLERHLVDSLTQDGHRNPDRAVAIRMGIWTLARGLASGILDVREGRRHGDGPATDNVVDLESG